MAISLASLKRSTTLSRPRILVHGVAGVGKTTFASKAEKPVVIPTEDGLGTIEVDHFPLAKSLSDVSRRRSSRYTRNRTISGR